MDAQSAGLVKPTQPTALQELYDAALLHSDVSNGQKMAITGSSHNPQPMPTLRKTMRMSLYLGPIMLICIVLLTSACADKQESTLASDPEIKGGAQLPA